jgi:acetyl esterase/lipase
MAHLSRILFSALVASIVAGCGTASVSRCDDVHTADGVSPDIARQLRVIGRVSAPDETRPLYAPLQAREPFDGVRIVRDLRYGPAGRNRLDVFTSDEGAAKPVLLFVHGGAYVGGDKSVAGSPFYTNIGAWAARNGMVGINMTYRLAPQDPWPAAQQDIAGGLAWARAHAAEYGGDPNRIFLMGHSAGASHVANYMGHPELQGAEAAGIVGAIMVSAFYDYDSLNATTTFKQYHGTDKAVYVKRSPLPGLMASKVPMLFVVAEFDTPEFNQQAEFLRSRYVVAGRCPDLVMLTNHSHMSEIYSVGTADIGLTSAVLRFVKAR